MKHRLLPRADALLLRKRGLIDSVIALLKNQAQIEHARHRSVSGFLASLLSGLVAYCHVPAKLSLNRHEAALLIPY